MKLIRLNSLSNSEYKKIRARQKARTMKTYFDDEGYLCYDKNELSHYKGKKSGRKAKENEF